MVSTHVVRGLPVLEVVVLSAEDARRAVGGGADRLELVADIATGGLTPSPQVLAQVRAAAPDVPVRVMLRTNAGFSASAAEVESLVAAVRGLAAEGADGFVTGFVADGGVDRVATTAVAEAVSPCPWTFHHAFDRIVAEPADAWAQLAGLTGVDHVLTAGSPGGLERGLERVRALARMQQGGPVVMAGGGLRTDLMPLLLAAGVRVFHVGSGARFGGDWHRTVSEAAVRRWRRVLDGP